MAATTLLLLALVLQTGPPSPAALADNYIKALGGEQLLRSVRSRITTGRFDNGRGLSTTYRIVEKAPTSRVTIIGSAPIESDESSGRGYDGTNGWDKSFIGTELRVVTGPELADLAREADMLAPLRLLAGCNTPSVERTAGADILSCALPDGGKRRYHFNRRSGLLDSYETPARRGSVTIRDEDYRDVGGLRLPGKPSSMSATRRSVMRPMRSV